MQSSRSRLQYHVTHSAAKIKHVRTLLNAAASGTTNTFFPTLLLPSFLFFFFFFSSCMPPLNSSQKGSPPEPDPLSCAQTTPGFAFYRILSWTFMYFVFVLFFQGGMGVHENNIILITTRALYQRDPVCLVILPSLLMGESRCSFEFFTGWRCAARCTPSCLPPSRCWENKCV